MIRRLIFIVPTIGFVVIAVFLALGLLKAREIPIDVLPSVLIDKPAPPIDLPALNAQTPGFTRADLAAGHVTVINFFASWCVPCREEAPVLMTLSKSSGFVLAGVAYKDKRPDTEAFLTSGGNPFAAIVADNRGQVAIDWGVTAAPETFVVDGKGVIRFKYVGELTAGVVSEQLMPAIQKASQAG